MTTVSTNRNSLIFKSFDQCQLPWYCMLLDEFLNIGWTRQLDWPEVCMLLGKKVDGARRYGSVVVDETVGGKVFKVRRKPTNPTYFDLCLNCFDGHSFTECELEAIAQARCTELVEFNILHYSKQGYYCLEPRIANLLRWYKGERTEFIAQTIRQGYQAYCHCCVADFQRYYDDFFRRGPKTFEYWKPGTYDYGPSLNLQPAQSVLPEVLGAAEMTLNSNIPQADRGLVDQQYVSPYASQFIDMLEEILGQMIELRLSERKEAKRKGWSETVSRLTGQIEVIQTFRMIASKSSFEGIPEDCNPEELILRLITLEMDRAIADIRLKEEDKADILMRDRRNASKRIRDIDESIEDRDKRLFELYKFQRLFAASGTN